MEYSDCIESIDFSNYVPWNPGGLGDSVSVIIVYGLWDVVCVCVVWCIVCVSLCVARV